MVASRLEALKECLILEAEHESRKLGEAILKAKLIPAKAATDAFHIATAAVFGMDFLLTWNCRHIANAFIAGRMRAVCEREGYNAPVLCTPYELMIESD